MPRPTLLPTTFMFLTSTNKNKNILFFFFFLLQIKTKSQANLTKPHSFLKKKKKRKKEKKRESKKYNLTSFLKMKSSHVAQIMTWKSLSLHMLFIVVVISIPWPTCQFLCLRFVFLSTCCFFLLLLSCLMI